MDKPHIVRFEDAYGELIKAAAAVLFLTADGYLPDTDKSREALRRLDIALIKAANQQARDRLK